MVILYLRDPLSQGCCNPHPHRPIQAPSASGYVVQPSIQGPIGDELVDNVAIAMIIAAAFHGDQIRMVKLHDPCNLREELLFPLKPGFSEPLDSHPRPVREEPAVRPSGLRIPHEAVPFAEILRHRPHLLAREDLPGRGDQRRRRRAGHLPRPPAPLVPPVDEEPDHHRQGGGQDEPAHHGEDDEVLPVAVIVVAPALWGAQNGSNSDH